MGWERAGPEMTRPAATERTRSAAPLAAARGICGTLRAVVPADALAEAPVASYRAVTSCSDDSRSGQSSNAGRQERAQRRPERLQRCRERGDDNPMG